MVRLCFGLERLYASDLAITLAPRRHPCSLLRIPPVKALKVVLCYDPAAHCSLPATTTFSHISHHEIRTIPITSLPSERLSSEPYPVNCYLPACPMGPFVSEIQLTATQLPMSFAFPIPRLGVVDVCTPLLPWPVMMQAEPFGLVRFYGKPFLRWQKRSRRLRWNLKRSRERKTRRKNKKMARLGTTPQYPHSWLSAWLIRTGTQEKRDRLQQEA
jgi:hypothetical protein